MIQLFKKHLINYCVFLFSGVFVAYILLITKTNIGSWFYFFIVLINYFTLSYILKTIIFKNYNKIKETQQNENNKCQL